MGSNNISMRLICRHPKRYSQACPLDLSEVSVYYSIDAEPEQQYQLFFSVTNSLESGLDDGIRQATIVIRCFGADKQPILLNGKEYAAKTLTFSGDGLGAQQSSGELGLPILPDNKEIADVEVYVSRVHFVNDEICEYQRADFYELPGRLTLISSILPKEQTELFKDSFGDTARYVPEKLSDIVWRCTCGEICTSDTCETCKTDKAELFAAAAGFSEIRARSKKILIPILIGSILLLLIAAAILTGTILSARKKRAQENAADTTAEVTTDVSESETTKLALAYMQRGLYDEALSVARAAKYTDLTKTILRAAVSNYKDHKEYDKAYEYAAQLADPEVTEEVVRLAYDQALKDGDYEKALKYAAATGDPNAVTETALQLINTLTDEEDYQSAIRISEIYAKDRTDEIIRTAISRYTDRRKYDEAIEFAQKYADVSIVKSTASAAANDCLKNGDPVSAFKYALVTESEALLSTVCEEIPDDELRNNYLPYFPYLTMRRKQKVLATPVAMSKTPVAVRDAHTAYYGNQQTYSNSTYEIVSVAAGNAHTLFLLSNGKVVAKGDNSFGQCDVSDWRDVVAISAGEFHTVALTAEGEVLACGLNVNGQCDVSSVKNAAMVDAGSYHTVVLLQDGTLFACGENSYGQCNVQNASNAIAVSAGQTHTLVLFDDGTVGSVGSDQLGQRDVEDWSNIAVIAAGNCFSVAVSKGGKVFVCGQPVNVGDISGLNGFSGVSAIAAGNVAVTIVSTSGRLVMFGSGIPDVYYVNTFTAEQFAFSD